MKKSLVFILIATMLILGCVQQKPTAKSVKLENVVYDCQCHEQPWTYKPHLNTSCLKCHGNEIIPKHKAIFKKYNITAKNVTEINCYQCHERSLLANHLPKHTCELCHGNPYQIHEKFLKKFYEGVSK